MTEVDQAISKLSSINTTDKVLESLRLLHHSFQSQKADTIELSLDSDLLINLSKLLINYPDNQVKIETLSLLSVVSLNSSWSDTFAVDSYMSLVSNMLDSKNIPLSTKVIDTARHVLETNHVASQSLNSFSTLIYSLTQLLQSKDLDDKGKESLLKSFLYILDTYNIEDQKSKKKKEKEKFKGKKSKEKEKEKENTTSSVSSSSSSSTSSTSSSLRGSEKKVVPSLPVALTELATIVNTLLIEGGVFVRSHAQYVLDIIKEKFKIKIKSQKKKKDKDDSSDDDKSDSDDEDDDDLPKFLQNSGGGLTYSKHNRMVVAQSQFRTVIFNKDVSEGIHKFTFTATNTVGYFSMMIGAVKKEISEQVKNSNMASVTARACWYLNSNQSYAYTPNTTNLTTVSNVYVTGGVGVVGTFGIEYNAEENWIGFYNNKTPAFKIKNVPSGVVIGISVQYGTLTIKKYEELDEPLFPKSGYSTY